MKLVVEEAGLCRGGSRKDRTAAGVSTSGDAGGQRVREGMIKWLQVSVLGKKG